MSRFFAAFTLIVGALVAPSQVGLADGKVVPPRKYEGSLEEKAQEAIIIFQASKKAGNATEDLILKIRVAGEAEQFAWIVPFPNKPTVKEEDAKLFRECFRYVEARTRRSRDSKAEGSAGGEAPAAKEAESVRVLSREVVGSFDVAVVQEVEAGTLNKWLTGNGYQSLEGADDVLEFYRRKEYVYACIKVDADQLAAKKDVDIHPLRFTFKTGGRDGIYFPMKLTGLQTEPFDVNLYVFYRFWLNDRLSKFGYVHRGFTLRHRDWDTKQCVPNGGKSFSDPDNDPYLKGYGRYFPSVTKLLRKLHPGERYYLTNIQASRLDPKDVRDWSDDLWLFPYYTNRDFVPFDVRDNGPASGAWPNTAVSASAETQRRSSSTGEGTSRVIVAGTVAFVLAVGGLVALMLRGRSEPSVH